MPARGAGASAPFDRRLVRAVPTVRVVVVVSVGLGLVSTGAVVVQAMALAGLLAGAMAGAGAADPSADFIWLGGAVVVRAAAALAGEIVARVGAAGGKADLRTMLLDASLASAPVGEGPAPGALAVLAGRGLDALDVYLARALPDLVLGAVAPIALVVAVGALDWISACVLVVAVALFPVFAALVGRASMSLAAHRWRQVESLGDQVADVFAGLPILRALGRSRAQRDGIARASEALRAASQHTLRVAFLSGLVLDTLASVAVALVAVPLGLRLLEGTVPLSHALGVLIVAPEVLVPLRRASAEFHESTEGLAAADAAFGAIGAAQRTRDTARLAERAARQAPGLASAPVALRAVRVTFPGRSEPVLDKATLVIHPGETVALVGANGAGKSTVASLLLGFGSPTSGSVRVGETDLGDVDPLEWRRRIAYLPERPVILGASLADNLRLAHPAASDAELVRVLGDVGALEFVAGLAEGLDTRLGEGGRPTSAGERQRIALARVLLRPASLYVLDEPTVHLDVEGEDAVLRALARALGGASALIVTHRPQALCLADRVVELRHGRFAPRAQRAERTVRA